MGIENQDDRYNKPASNPEIKPVPNQVISPDEVKNISLGYENIQKNPDFVSKLNNQYEGDNSLTGILAHNEQIQGLLNDMLSSYGNYVKQDETVLKKIIEKKKNHENKNPDSEQGEMVECFEEYMLNNDSQDGFEQFLLSNGCIRGVILSYINDHSIGKDGKINVNLISKNNIKAKIKAEWHKKLYMNYNEQYGLEPNEKLTKAMNFGESIKNIIDGIISDYLSNGIGDKKFLESLEGLIGRGKNNETIKKFLEDDPNAMDKCNFLLRNSIKEYSRLLDIGNENRTLQKTSDNVFDTQLRAYLFLYGKIFYPDVFKSGGGKLEDHEGELGKILEAILVSDGKLDKTENNEGENKYIQEEEKYQTELRDREIKARRNPRRPRVRDYSPNKDVNQLSNNIENKNFDIQNATGVEIAHEMDLGKDLEGFKMKEIKSDADVIFRKKIVFKKTCRDFLAKNGEKLHNFNIRISDLFYLKNDDASLLVNNRNLDALSGKLNSSEANEIRNLVNLFVVEFNNNLKEINGKMDDKKESVHNVVKEYAIGAVIDNIKDMFQSIVKTSNESDFLSGFEFNEKESAKIESNKLIISGKFNGENLILKYDLNSGELYMNSYISNIDNNTMVIGDNSPSLKIGELKPFQDVLDSFYESPTESMSNEVFPKIRRNPNQQTESGENSNKEAPRMRPSPRRGIEARKRMREEHKRKLQEICGTKLDEINGKIKDQAESKTTQNYAVSNLLKTLNVMPETDNYNETIYLKENSDLYKVVQTITNSENDDISYFSNYLGKLMKYIGLKWGKNNLLGQDKTTEDARLIFNNEEKNKNTNENKNNNIVGYLGDKTGNFNDEYNRMDTDGKHVFDSGANFGILSVINEKFVEGKSPNGKLKMSKIDDFNTEFSRELSFIKINKKEANEANNGDISRIENELREAYE